VTARPGFAAEDVADVGDLVDHGNAVLFAIELLADQTTQDDI
jgi:hypothetical protein